MGGAILLVVLLGLAMGAAWLATGRQRLLFPMLILYAALAFGVVLALVDASVPFATGGDDKAYFRASQVRLRDLGSWFDFNQFTWFAQGGYPLLLAWVYQVAGASTFVYKAVNLFLYLLLGVVWHRIGDEIGGRRTAAAFSAAILLSTPLWMYWMFVYKDMVIVLLQSVFLLGAVRLASGHGGRRAWWPILAGTILLIPFRIYLVVLHVAVLVATVLIAARHTRGRRVALVATAAVLLGGIVYIGANPRVLAAFGAMGEDRVLDYETLRGVSERYVDKRSKFSGPMGAAMFPVAYVFGEVSGLQVGVAGQGAQEAARPDVIIGGLGALPWIFFGVPLFGFALYEMGRRRLRMARAGPAAAGAYAYAHAPVMALAPAGPAPPGAHPGMFVPAMRLAPAPAYAPGGTGGAAAAGAADPSATARGWLPLLVFLAFYAVVAWLVEDTTRWRMPAFPVMAALAAQAWLWLEPGRRAILVIGWASALAALFTVYYGVLR